jgi:hypothetical protein
MENLIKVIDKGYNVSITSYEDGGNYRSTKTHFIEDKEDAKLIYKLCTELFTENKIGNCVNGEGDSIIAEYIKDNPELFKNFFPEIDFVEFIYILGYELMGDSQYYDFRVCESCQIVYSPEDIYLEEIKF